MEHLAVTAAPAGAGVPRRPRCAHGRRRGVGVALMAGIALCGSVSCSSSDGSPTAVPSSSVTRSPTPSPTPVPPPPVRWPLTGLESSTPIDHPALAVKIENSVDARPQTGLGAADLVWEEVVQGGITRYVAVYHSTLPPEVGPVRSIRAVDPSIAAPLHGLFAFSGGQQAYIGGAAAAGLQLLSNDAGGARSSTSRPRAGSRPPRPPAPR